MIYKLNFQHLVFFRKQPYFVFVSPHDFGVTGGTYKHTNWIFLKNIFIMDWIALLIYHGKDMTKSQHFQNISIIASPNFPNRTIENYLTNITLWCPPSYVGFLMYFLAFLQIWSFSGGRSSFDVRIRSNSFRKKHICKELIKNNIVQGIIHNRQNFGVPPSELCW